MRSAGALEAFLAAEREGRPILSRGEAERRETVFYVLYLNRWQRCDDGFAPVRGQGPDIYRACFPSDRHPIPSVQDSTRTSISNMKFASVAASVSALCGVASAAVKGFDISHYQPNVDFAKAYADGARFVMIKVRSPR